MEAANALAVWLIERSGRLLDHVYREGREHRAARQAADRQAIEDTFDQVLDALAMIESMVDRDWGRAQRAKLAWEERRYRWALPELLAGEDLVLQLSETVPAVVEALPRVPRQLRARLGHVSNVVRAARRAQIDCVIDGKRPLAQTAEDRAAMRGAGDRVDKSLARFSGVGVARLMIGI